MGHVMAAAELLGLGRGSSPQGASGDLDVESNDSSRDEHGTRVLGELWKQWI